MESVQVNDTWEVFYFWQERVPIAVNRVLRHPGGPSSMAKTLLTRKHLADTDIYKHPWIMPHWGIFGHAVFLLDNHEGTNDYLLFLAFVSTILLSSRSFLGLSGDLTRSLEAILCFERHISYARLVRRP